MKGVIDLNDWLGQISVSKMEIESIHFDSISGFECEKLSGVELVHCAYQLLQAVVIFVRSLADIHGIKHTMVFLPVGMSDELERWHVDIWNRLGCVDEPPSLYLLRDSQIFDENSEEYRCPIAVPIENEVLLRAVFRSFRNQEAIENSWEFSSGIYLIASID